MINLSKTSTTIKTENIFVYFIIMLFVICPIYFGYHHFVVNDFIITHNNIILDKTNQYKGGKYDYKLVLKSMSDSTTITQHVTADSYIHHNINDTYITNNINWNLNPIMTVIGVLEVTALIIVVCILGIVGIL